MKVRKGFTLVELLIVMAIIAALMAVLIPTAGGAMKKAKATKIAVTMRNIEQAAEQWLMAELPQANNGSYSITIDNLVSKGYLNDGDYTNYSLDVSETGDIITIKVQYTTTDSDLANMIEGSLKETYPNVDYTNNNVTIEATISKFW